ncbi:MAG TPA: M36 family metallopeptidase [Aldersonia sp.]
MAPKVWLDDAGTVDRLVGDTVSVPADSTLRPAVSVGVALRVAAAEAAKSRTLATAFGEDVLPELDISADEYPLLSSQPRNDRAATFARGSFEEDIPARLVYLYTGPSVRLTWMFTFSREHLVAQYRAFVEADEQTANQAEPEILYFYETSSRAISARVFQHNPDEGAMEQVSFPLPAAAYPVEAPTGLPVGFPLPWNAPVNGNISTQGNNTMAVNGTTRQPFVVGVVDGGGEFAAAENSPEQLVTNIFYFCNYMHDFFLMLGFDEESGNFQTLNVTGGGRGADPVHAFAHPNPVFGTANMATRADGQFAVMNMGLVAATGRHTANDADVVFHEFVHGVSNRLVGGMRDANALEEPQSGAMGEGWSDYFALTIRNFARDDERTVTGSWVVNSRKGIRQRPYDSAYPGKFGHIGLGRGQVAGAGNADLSYRQVHAVGEIWCAALIEATRNVVEALGDDKRRGYRITWQAVVDGMKLTPKNPSMLEARDAVLAALAALPGLTEDERARVRTAAWRAFADFEMGADASCPNASFTGCSGGSKVPSDAV